MNFPQTHLLQKFMTAKECKLLYKLAEKMEDDYKTTWCLSWALKPNRNLLCCYTLIVSGYLEKQIVFQLRKKEEKVAVVNIRYLRKCSKSTLLSIFFPTGVT